MNDTETMNTTTPTPEVNGGERLFTQSEVNKIVSDRLARERDRLADNNEYRALYEATKQELEGMKAAQLRQKKETAYRAIAKLALDPQKTGVLKTSRMDTVVKAALVNGIIDGMELDESGQAKDADKLREAIAAEWPEYIITVETRGADIAHPPYMVQDPVDERIAAAFKPKI